MLATVFTDLHIHNYKQFDNNGSRLKNCLDVIDTIFHFNNKNGIKVTLFPGDLYHNQKLLPTQAVNETIKCFHRNFEQYPDQIFLAVTGNHDFASKNIWTGEEKSIREGLHDGISALEHLSFIFNGRFVLLDNSVYQFKKECIYIHGIPYYEYPEDFRKALELAASNAIPEGRNILMIHQTPAGTGNDCIPVDTDPEDELYNVFDYVFCGHIHERIQINPKFLIVGTPIQHNWGDSGKEKGFVVINLDDTEAGYKFIPLTKYPKFIRVEKGEDWDKLGRHNYIVEKPIDIQVDLVEQHKAQNFKADLEPRILLENFWKEVSTDEKLLKTGIKFLP